MSKSNIYKLAIAAMMALPANTHAQCNEILRDGIASLQVMAGDNWLAMPVTQLGGEPINIAFDDLTHEHRRYAYRLDHCEADWTKSDGLFDSDYCEGFADGVTIDDSEQSINTNVLYTHYSLQIPNQQSRIKMSGNYRLTVYDDNDGGTVLTACFMVVEPLMSLSLNATRNTDIDNNAAHQQVAMRLDYGQARVTAPDREIKTVVLQNGRWDNARRDPQPQFRTAGGMEWSHNRALIFDGGNEYRKFEILDTDHPTLGIENTGWDGTQYYAEVWTDLPRPNYVYDEDANGAFYIRNSDNRENDRLSEYVDVRFRLKAPKQPGPVYLNGVWTNDRFDPIHELHYNDTTQNYEATVMLKQGYYSYQYLWLDTDGNTHNVSSEGNFAQTENQYQALAYYRPNGARADRLVAYAKTTLGTR